MRRTWMAISLACAAATLSISGCSDTGVDTNRDTRLNSEPPPPSAQAYADQLIRSSGGLAVRRADMESIMADLARDVAIAMDDPETRKGIYSAIRGSKIRENKLHFRTFLRAPDSALLPRMSAVTGGGTERVLARLDSIVDLEFYMPIPVHRERWTGEQDFIVVSYPNDDGAQPRGFDRLGREVPVSAFVAPEVSTLVLTPVETNFSASSNGSGAPAMNLAPSGPQFDHVTGASWWLTEMHLDDLHEGVLNGNPELEVHGFLEQATGIYSSRWCTGEDMPVPYNWNNDSEDWDPGTWSKLITDAVIGDTHLKYEVWENDNTSCQSSNGSSLNGGSAPDTDSPNAGEVANLATRVFNIYDALNSNNHPIRKIVSITATTSTITSSGAFNADDFVGDVKGPYNACWPYNSQEAVFDIVSGHGSQYEGGMKIATDYGVREPVCAGPSLVASVTGPWNATTCSSATYEAVASNGAPPYSFAWTYTSGVSQNSHSASLTLWGMSPGTTHVEVTATDANGMQASHWKDTSVSSC